MRSVVQVVPALLVSLLAIYSYGTAPMRRTEAAKKAALGGHRSASSIAGPIPARDPFVFTWLAPIPSGKAQKAEDGPRAASNGEENAGAVEVNIEVIAAELVLAGTVVRDGQRSAVINGQIYNEGNLLVGIEPPVTVSQIFTDRVVVSRGSQSAALTFDVPSDQNNKKKDELGGGSAP